MVSPTSDPIGVVVHADLCRYRGGLGAGLVTPQYPHFIATSRSRYIIASHLGDGVFIKNWLRRHQHWHLRDGDLLQAQYFSSFRREKAEIYLATKIIGAINQSRRLLLRSFGPRLSHVGALRRDNPLQQQVASFWPSLYEFSARHGTERGLGQDQVSAKPIPEEVVQPYVIPPTQLGFNDYAPPD